MPHYFFFFLDNADPAKDFDTLEDLELCKTLLAVDATFLEVCFKFFEVIQ